MKLNISKKIILSIIVLLLFSSVMGVYSLYSTSSAAKVSSDIAIRFIPITGYNMDITRSLLTLIRDVQMFLLQNSEIDYNEALAMIQNLNKNIKEVRNHISDPTVKKVMPQTIVKFDELLPALEEYIQIAQLSMKTAMDSIPREKRLKENIAVLTKTLNDFRLNMEEAVVSEIKGVNTDVAVRASGHLNLVNTMSRLCMSATDALTTGLSNNNLELLRRK